MEWKKKCLCKLEGKAEEIYNNIQMNTYINDFKVQLESKVNLNAVYPTINSLFVVKFA